MQSCWSRQRPWQRRPGPPQPALQLLNQRLPRQRPPR